MFSVLRLYSKASDSTLLVLKLKINNINGHVCLSFLRRYNTCVSAFASLLEKQNCLFKNNLGSGCINLQDQRPALLTERG